MQKSKVCTGIAVAGLCFGLIATTSTSIRKEIVHNGDSTLYLLGKRFLDGSCVIESARADPTGVITGRAITGCDVDYLLNHRELLAEVCPKGTAEVLLLFKDVPNQSLMVSLRK